MDGNSVELITSYGKKKDKTYAQDEIPEKVLKLFGKEKRNDKR